MNEDGADRARLAACRVNSAESDEVSCTEDRDWPERDGTDETSCPVNEDWLDRASLVVCAEDPSVQRSAMANNRCRIG